jgi:hypothetical protein
MTLFWSVSAVSVGAADIFDRLIWACGSGRLASHDRLTAYARRAAA